MDVSEINLTEDLDTIQIDLMDDFFLKGDEKTLNQQIDLDIFIPSLDIQNSLANISKDFS